MIIQLKGKVDYPITLDPTVWIFDDRKVVFEEAFIKKEKTKEVPDHVNAAERFNKAIYQRSERPPVNKSINRFEKEKILTHSFVMPINDFCNHAEFQSDASRAILKTDSDDVIITIEQLQQALFLFAVDGKPIRTNGPIHLYFGDGSNQNAPIKSVKQIIID